MADDLRVDDRIVIPGDELEMTASRSGGPGGQAVNTTDSRVRLRWRMGASEVVSGACKQRLTAAFPSWVTQEGDVVITSDVHRSQQRNAEEVRKRLAEALYRALRPPPPRRDTQPTKASKKRRVDEKKQRSQTKRMRGRVDSD